MAGGFLEADIIGRRLTETGFASAGLGAQDGAQMVQPDFVAHVVEEEEPECAGETIGGGGHLGDCTPFG
jgi:hypothetical protein